jgi:PEP-CTERM motif
MGVLPSSLQGDEMLALFNLKMLGPAALTTRARYLATAAILALGAFAAPSAQAGYVVTLEEVGSNVVATGSGPIDLTGLNFVANGLPSTSVIPNESLILTGPGNVIDIYNGISGPSSFGSGSQTIAGSGAGDPVGIWNLPGNLFVPSGYVSDSPLSDTATYDDQTFASLGVTPGVYEWTWGAGANQNFTLDVGASTVPEPSTWAMLLIGFAGLGYAAVRRKGAVCAISA